MNSQLELWQTNLCILIIEDNRGWVNGIKTSLRKQFGTNVRFLEARTCRQALILFNRYQKELDVVIIDDMLKSYEKTEILIQHIYDHSTVPIVAYAIIRRIINEMVRNGCIRGCCKLDTSCDIGSVVSSIWVPNQDIPRDN